MKIIKILTLIIGLTFLNCNHGNSKETTENEQAEKLQVGKNLKDKEEIQNLIRQVLIWGDSKSNSDLFPAQSDSKDSLYIGVDLSLHVANIDKMIATNYFSPAFIENYNQIVKTLDKKLKNKKNGVWYVGEMPPFNFVSGVNPWCLCQDHLNWESVVVDVIELNSDKGELKWKWGDVEPGYYQSWKEFEYKFRVVKEDDKWKVSYLQGFDFDEIIN